MGTHDRTHEGHLHLVSPDQGRARVAQPGRGRSPESPLELLDFDVHGWMTVRVARAASTAPLVSGMFAPFAQPAGLTPGLLPDLVITGHDGLVGPARAEHERAHRYTEARLHLRSLGVHIWMADDQVHISGSRELVSATLPVVDALLVERDVAMIHAATVSYRGRGIALPAPAGVGKTSTVAKLLRLPRVSFMSDDWAFLTGEGELLGYAKPLVIKPHHRRIYPHLFQGRRKPLIPWRLSKRVSRLAKRADPYLARHPQLASVARRWTPEYRTVTPRQAFPNSPIATGAPLATAVFVERFDGEHAVLEARDPAWMVARMIGNFHAELPGPSREVITGLAATGLVPLERFYATKAGVLGRALEGTPCFSLQVPVWMRDDTASDVIVHHLRQVFRITGIE